MTDFTRSENPASGTANNTRQDCSSSVYCSRNSAAVGVDKLTLRFRTTSSTMERPRFHREVEYQHHRFWIDAYGLYARVEFNPSRIIDPYGVSLASVEDTIPATEGVWGLVNAHVSSSGPLSSAEVTRLDLARDFGGVQQPASFLRAVSVLNRAYQDDPHFFTDACTGDIKSLMVGSKDNRVRLYRKDLESPGVAPPGTIRWEWQGRGRPLDRYGIESFGDLTPQLAQQIAEDRWDWSKMWTEVAMVPDPLAAFDALGLSETVTSRLFVGQLRLSTQGVWPSSPYARKQLRDHIGEHGFIMEMEPSTSTSGLGLAQRLDWPTGLSISTTVSSGVTVSPPVEQ